MKSDKKAINYYSSFYEVSKELTVQQFYDFNMAIYKVMFFDEHIDNINFSDTMLNIIWKSVKHSIKSSVDGYCNKKNIPYVDMIKVVENKINTPCQPPYEEPYQQEKEKEKEKEEIPHTYFSFQEEIKAEPKPVINQDLKSMISKQAKSENKVTDIISFYRDNISNRNEDIQEVASYNQILIKNYDMDKMLIGLQNYKRFLEVSKKTPMKLFFFIRDAIYNDYQVENVIATGKNIAVVPFDLVGKRFIIEGEEIEFENDGYNKVGKDWKVTNAKNVEEMVRLARSVA